MRRWRRCCGVIAIKNRWFRSALTIPDCLMVVPSLGGRGILHIFIFSFPSLGLILLICGSTLHASWSKRLIISLWIKDSLDRWFGRIVHWVVVSEPVVIRNVLEPRWRPLPTKVRTSG